MEEVTGKFWTGKFLMKPNPTLIFLPLIFLPTFFNHRSQKGVRPGRCRLGYSRPSAMPNHPDTSYFLRPFMRLRVEF